MHGHPSAGEDVRHEAHATAAGRKVEDQHQISVAAVPRQIGRRRARRVWLIERAEPADAQSNWPNEHRRLQSR